ncbi:MAG: 3-hydroxyacyl-CoA dehydrogenase family protein, partial [Calditrichia bacterium]
ADLVGLDTLAHVAQTAYEKCTEDESRNMFKIPEILNKMLENKWLGAKTGSGFYQKVKKDILSLDFENMEYTPQKKVRMDGLRVSKKQNTISGKINSLAYSDDVAGKFTWELLSKTLIYSANRIPEITDDIVNVDNAMKWGFGWQLGPFETWDALGFERSLERMESEGKKVPAWVKEMHNLGFHSFYQQQKNAMTYFDISPKSYQPIHENLKVVRLNVLKNSDRELKKNWNTSLLNLGDDVALVEFHSIVQPDFNPLDGPIMDMLSDAVDFITNSGFKALVIGHQAQQFTVGANLALILKYAEEKDWDMLEKLSKTFQDTGKKLRFAPFPVVAAPFNMCLGGGFEIIGACDRRVASAESYIGLVEAGVGLVPGGGGNLRLLQHNIQAMSKGRPGPFPPVQKTFQTVGFARVSTSAKEAVFLGYLTKDDKIVINPDHLIYEAKQEALKMAENYQPPEMNKEIILPGEGGRIAIESTLDNMVKAGTISQHDALIGRKLAYILSGGDKASLFNPVDEQYLLDIEREAFVSLCSEPLTIQRMQHMLKTGKPLRN